MKIITFGLILFIYLTICSNVYSIINIQIENSDKCYKIKKFMSISKKNILHNQKLKHLVESIISDIALLNKVSIDFVNKCLGL